MYKLLVFSMKRLFIFAFAAFFFGGVGFSHHFFGDGHSHNLEQRLVALEKMSGFDYGPAPKDGQLEARVIALEAIVEVLKEGGHDLIKAQLEKLEDLTMEISADIDSEGLASVSARVEALEAGLDALSTRTDDLETDIVPIAELCEHAHKLGHAAVDKQCK